MTRRKPANPAETREILANDAARRREIEERLLAELARHGYPEASKFPLRLALEEAVMNAFRHGHRHKPEATVTVTWRVDPQKVVISVEDQGPGFDPHAVPDPTTPEHLEKPSGRGIMLMRAYMAEVSYNEHGNRVTMVYERPPG